MWDQFCTISKGHIVVHLTSYPCLHERQSCTVNVGADVGPPLVADPSCLASVPSASSAQVLQEVMSDQSHHESILDKLPLEIVVHSLCYTNASTVCRFSSCSSACKALVDDNSQIIYQSLALRQFNALTLCTAGDSGITRETLPDFVVRQSENAQNEGDIAPVDAELQRAIRCQRTSSGAYDSVKTWKDFSE